jgi:aspartate 1-decarboxylase
VLRTIVKSKNDRATVTRADLGHEGSCSFDPDLTDSACENAELSDHFARAVHVDAAKRVLAEAMSL